ncbi:hypothetical protein EUX98_g1410 [Antrodiella citrinella]|uniref:F-box domain-containing protein n=1 Tax=Antrodiella citrinella TaxID=2447956 RepID=A0A4S4N346_9APHY|nr:hypothetical protein EUX98_g1410 [Antrodiella citrinella]
MAYSTLSSPPLRPSKVSKIKLNKIMSHLTIEYPTSVGGRDSLNADDHTRFTDPRNRTSGWVRTEVQETLKHLQALYSLLNADVPACRLPPELLSLIFFWTITATAPKTHWIRIAHRTDSAPLRLVYDHDYLEDCQHSADFAKLIGPYPSRFRTMDIVSPPAVMKTFATLFDAPQPHLTHLSLASICGWKSQDDQEPHILPDGFAAQLPPLHYLSLKYATLPSWDLRAFSGLRTLRLSHQHPSLSPSMNAFLDILQGCPMLEELLLHNAGPTLGKVVAPYPVPTRSVTLSMLRRITLTQDHYFDIPFLLAHLVVPETARIDVKYLGPSLKSVTPFEHWLPRHVSNLGSLRTVSYLRIASECGYFDISGADLGSSESDLSHRSLVRISLKRTLLVRDSADLLYDALRQLPSPSSQFSQCPLRYLDITVPPWLVSEADWAALFAAFPLLEGLVVQSTNCEIHHKERKKKAFVSLLRVLGTPAFSLPYLLSAPRAVAPLMRFIKSTHRFDSLLGDIAVDLPPPH